MSRESFNLAGPKTNIAMETDREYRLTVDLQWYGLEDGKMYSYIIASAHEAKDKPAPPYYLTGFCINRGKLLPLNLIGARKSVASLIKVLKSYNDLALRDLTVAELKEVKNNIEAPKGKSSFIIPNSKLRILYGEEFEYPDTPSVFISWGSLEAEVRQFDRAIGESASDYVDFMLDTEFDKKLRQIDYRDDAIVYLDFGSGKEQIFSAYPMEAVPAAPNQVLIKAGNFGEELKLQKTSSLSAADCDGRSIVYLVLRMSGLPEENIKIEGLNTAARNIYTVVFPIRNFKIETTLAIGEVVFHPKLPDTETIFFNKHLESAERLSWSDSFTVGRVNIEATTFYDAYLLGAEEVDKALDILSHFARDSAPFVDHSAISELSKWKRLTGRPMPKRERYGLLINNTGIGSVFLDWSHVHQPTELNDRDIIETIKENAATYEEALFFSKEMTGSKTEKQVKALMRALRWLKRAWESESTVDKVIYLSTALEFCVYDVKPPKFLQKQIVKQITKSAANILKSIDENEYASKGSDMCNKISQSLTEPPLMIKVQHIINELEIPVSDTDLGVLKRMRDQRNDVVHGRDEHAVTTADIQKAHGVISRIVAARLHMLIESLSESGIFTC